MDPLSDVLSLLKPTSHGYGGFDAGGNWSIQYPRHDGIKCFAVVSGECWLSVEGVAEAVRIGAGDCFLLPLGRSFCVGSDLTLPPVDASTFYPTAQVGGIIPYQGGGDFFSVGAHFDLNHYHADILLEVLPPIVHLRKESDKAVLRWSLERMREELRDPQPGGSLVAQHLADMMLVRALRLYLTEGLSDRVGWFFALADKQISMAINSMHHESANDWTIQKLAQCAGMSRSAFALKFRKTVGASPMEYLTRWRMLLAGDRVVNSNDSISVISLSLGYESEAAFSTAFKRAMGCSPRQYKRGHPPGRSLTPEVRIGDMAQPELLLASCFCKTVVDAPISGRWIAMLPSALRTPLSCVPDRATFPRDKSGVPRQANG